jgi:hypothetical protein
MGIQTGENLIRKCVAYTHQPLRTPEGDDDPTIEYGISWWLERLNDAQTVLALQTGFKRGTFLLDAVAGQQDYDQPNDLVWGLSRVTFDGSPLAPTTFEDISRDYPEWDSTDADTPTQFFMWGNLLYLWPAPVDNLSVGITLWGGKDPEPITWENPPDALPNIFHDGLSYGAVALAQLGNAFTSTDQLQETEFGRKFAGVIGLLDNHLNTRMRNYTPVGRRSMSAYRR